MLSNLKLCKPNFWKSVSTWNVASNTFQQDLQLFFSKKFFTASTFSNLFHTSQDSLTNYHNGLYSINRAIPILLSFPSPRQINSDPLKPCLLFQIRYKMTKSQAYRRPARASPTGQSNKAHIGIKRLSAEYVSRGQLLVKQRKTIPFNINLTRLRHFKIYPGENVRVTRNTSLRATINGRVKYTFNPFSSTKIVNVLPEKREELLKDELWRYRTEFIESMEENKHICNLRMKAATYYEKRLINPPSKPPLRPKFLGRWDEWENPALPDSHYFYKTSRNSLYSFEKEK